MTETPDKLSAVVEPLEKTFKTVFVVTASVPKLRGLRAFLEGKHYEFQEVKAENV